MFKGLRLSAREAWGAVRHVRDPRELVRAALPHVSPLVLNDGDGDEPSRSAQDLVDELRDLMHTLQSEAFIDGAVDYRGLASSPAFRRLEAVSKALGHLAPEQLPGRAVQLAFWINLYNVLAIHGVLKLGVRRSAMEVPTFFRRVAYQVGAHVFTLDDIENGVLRRSAINPVSGRPQWDDADPRQIWIADTLDPRIHAALVCTAKACPPVRVYEGDHIDAQLDLAARGYVAGHVVADTDARRLELPVTMHFYASDFDMGSGPQTGLREFLTRYAGASQGDAIRRAFDESWSVEYRPYDWSLNRWGG